MSISAIRLQSYGLGGITEGLVPFFLYEVYAGKVAMSQSPLWVCFDFFFEIENGTVKILKLKMTGADVEI